MVNISKWSMKQYWRVGTIRAILSLFLGMLVIGRYYYGFIPPLSNLGFLGAIILAATISLVFLGLGYLYDAKAQLWNQRLQVLIEHNPYMYTPNFRFLMAEYPIFYALIRVTHDLLETLNLDSDPISRLAVYLNNHFATTPDRIECTSEIEAMGAEFLSSYPFTTGVEPASLKEGLGNKAKKAFQLRVWRLSWVQNFTGLAQDVLVFAALYVAVLFPEAATNGVVSLDYMILGILTISLPLYIGLMLAGWYYDKKLRLWSPDWAVKVERDPYSYVPEPRTFGFVFPFIYALISFHHDLLEKLGYDTDEISKCVEFLNSYSQLTAATTSDMNTAKEIRAGLGNLFASVNLKVKKDGEV